MKMIAVTFPKSANVCNTYYMCYPKFLYKVTNFL